jgi:hypothetical protein
VVSGNRGHPGDFGCLDVSQPEENQMMPVSLSVPIVVSGSRVQPGNCGLLGVGQPEVTQMTSVSMSATPGDFGHGDSRFFGMGQLEAPLYVSKGSVLSQPLLGGEFTEEAS